VVCEDLERAFESRRRYCTAARSSVDSRVSTELAAYKNVEMERAKSDLEDHQSVCVSDARVRQCKPRGLPVFLDAMGRRRREVMEVSVPICRRGSEVAGSTMDNAIYRQLT
jgi:hypothetical protein